MSRRFGLVFAGVVYVRVGVTTCGSIQDAPRVSHLSSSSLVIRVSLSGGERYTTLQTRRLPCGSRDPRASDRCVYGLEHHLSLELDSTRRPLHDVNQCQPAPHTQLKHRDTEIGDSRTWPNERSSRGRPEISHSQRPRARMTGTVWWTADSPKRIRSADFIHTFSFFVCTWNIRWMYVFLVRKAEAVQPKRISISLIILCLL